MATSAPIIPPKSAIIGYIQAAARKRGIDPDVAVKVAKSEGLNADPNEGWQSTYVKNGKREESYGPFQLYMGGGLGNKFEKATGLDPRNPETVFQQVDFALDHAAKNGWGAWYGAKRVGLDNRAGIGPNAVQRGVEGGKLDMSLEARDERSMADRIEFADLDDESSEGGGRPQVSLADRLGISEKTFEFPEIPPPPDLPPPLPTVHNEIPEAPAFQNTPAFSRGMPKTRLTAPEVALESPEATKARQLMEQRGAFRESLMGLHKGSAA